MGGKLGIFRSGDRRRIGALRLDERDYEMLKNLWSEIETNPQKHSRGIYMRFFTLYPEYLKFFAKEDNIPRDDAYHLHNHFTTILSTMGFLILDVYAKPKSYDALLDYLAMIHQYMYLELQDFRNLVHAATDYLKDAMPEIITEECAEAFDAFVIDVADQMMDKMVKGRAFMARLIQDRNRNRRRESRLCRWLRQPDRLIYGHAQTYWIAKKHRWEVKMEKWKAGERSTDPLLKALNDPLSIDASENRNVPLSPELTLPHAQGSVMSEILQDKLWSDKDDGATYRSGRGLLSRTSINLKETGRLEQLTPRERFRRRRTSDESQNNQTVDHTSLQRDKSYLDGTVITARQRRRGSVVLPQDNDKTDH